MNLVRLGNEKILQQFNCTYLRKAAQEITRITTGFEPHPTQIVYGERALDMVLGIPNLKPDKHEFDVAKFFGEEPPIRITTMATPKMVAKRLMKSNRQANLTVALPVSKKQTNKKHYL